MSAALVHADRLIAKLRPLPEEVVTARPLVDRLLRPLTDLRLSVTDRCNFRCTYCMPRSKVGSMVAPARRDELLDFEELSQIAAAFVELGVKKLRITGGEPLVRRDLPHLVERLAKLAIPDLCMTTNGSLLAGQAQALVNAGLGRVTVSLDAIDELTFRRMTDGHTPLGRVLEGIDAARKAGLLPLKVNMVVQRGVNEHSVVPMAAWARREGLELRFIEYMDVGCSNGWQKSDVLTAEEIRERIEEHWPLVAMDTGDGRDTAERFRYSDGQTKIGIIASISRPFCAGCTRARVSSKGELYPCLFAPLGVDLASTLRDGGDIRPLIAQLWQRRTDRYSELRAGITSPMPRPEMSAIGG